MSSRSVRVGTRSGMHVRPCAVLAQRLANRPGRVQVITEDGRTANPRDVLPVIRLGLKRGDTVSVIGDPGPVDIATRVLESDLDPLADLMSHSDVGTILVGRAVADHLAMN